MSQVIPITCDKERRLHYFSWDELEEFQGNLKDLSVAGYEHMKQSLLKRGFSFPVYYWQDPSNSDRKPQLLDGHQRKRVFEREGWTVEGGKVPAIDIPGATEKEAAENLLEANSQHGMITEQGLYQFIEEKEIDWTDLPAYDLPGIRAEDFMLNFYGDPAAGGKARQSDPSAPERFPEYNEDIDTEYCCPKCGYEWSGKPK